MKELKVERSLLHVSNVEKLLDHPITSEDMNEFTLEQNLMHVNNGKTFYCSSEL
jgi:hypothetical protein